MIGSLVRPLGANAEEHAVRYLRKVGMTIIDRNVRTPEGEIDILAREGDTIVIIEVKARRSKRFGSAIGAVDQRKRARLRAAAANLLQFAPRHLQNVRFDVVTFDAAGLRHHRGAFA